MLAISLKVTRNYWEPGGKKHTHKPQVSDSQVSQSFLHSAYRYLFLKSTLLLNAVGSNLCGKKYGVTQTPKDLRQTFCLSRLTKWRIAFPSEDSSLRYKRCHDLRKGQTLRTGLLRRYPLLSLQHHSQADNLKATIPQSPLQLGFWVQIRCWQHDVLMQNVEGRSEEEVVSRLLNLLLPENMVMEVFRVLQQNLASQIWRSSWADFGSAAVHRSLPGPGLLS